MVCPKCKVEMHLGTMALGRSVYWFPAEAKYPVFRRPKESIRLNQPYEDLDTYRCPTCNIFVFETPLNFS